MKPVLVIDVVGLTRRQIGERTPHLRSLAARGVCRPMAARLPAVTCSMQATFLTGRPAREHGIVGNGWYFPELGEVLFWRQANACVQGEKVYETARAEDPTFTCAKLFWWWNMGAAVDVSVTPRPFYPADGRKLLATYGTPDAFHRKLLAELGPFPFFDFWGPRAGLPSSRWITDATLLTLSERRPTLTLAYLPHLDYDHQRFGPDHPRSLAALEEVDGLVGELVSKADEIGAETLVVSEYGIERVLRPVHPNRVLREAGLLTVRETPVGEVLDVFASRAFAVADHQVAHVVAPDPDEREEARRLLEATPGVAYVLDHDGKREHGLDHPRAGHLVGVAEEGAWFAYPYWLDDANAPDFARTVDIHRKPGYDPCELFVDPRLKLPALHVARRLLRKKLGMRYLMDVVPLDAALVGGSHGRLPDDPEEGPVLLCSRDLEVSEGEPEDERVEPETVRDRILALLRR